MRMEKEKATIEKDARKAQKYADKVAKRQQKYAEKVAKREEKAKKKAAAALAMKIKLPGIDRLNLKRPLKLSDKMHVVTPTKWVEMSFLKLKEQINAGKVSAPCFIRCTK